MTDLHFVINLQVYWLKQYNMTLKLATQRKSLLDLTLTPISFTLIFSSFSETFPILNNYTPHINKVFLYGEHYTRC